MLPEQHGQEPVWGYEAQEITLLVHHRESALPVLDRLPSGDLLIGVWGDHGRVGVHYLVCGRSLRSGEQVLYREDAHQLGAVKDRHVRYDVVPAFEEGSPDLFYQRSR